MREVSYNHDSRNSMLHGLFKNGKGFYAGAVGKY